MPKPRTKTESLFTAPPTAAAALVARLESIKGIAACEASASIPVQRYYLDSDDHAARENKLVIEATEIGPSIRLDIRNHGSEHPRWCIRTEQLPNTLDDLDQPAARAFLKKVLARRKLTPTSSHKLVLNELLLRNSHDKLISRVTIEANGSTHDSLIRIDTIPGFENDGETIREVILEAGIKPVNKADAIDYWRKVHKESRSRKSVNADPVSEVWDTVANAFESFMDLMEVHRIGTINDRDPEHLHQFRVSLRRTRSLFEVVDPYFTLDETEAFQRSLKKLNRVAGNQRDLDVLSELLPPHLERNSPGEAWVAKLLEYLVLERARAHAKLVRFFASDRYKQNIRRQKSLVKAIRKSNEGRGGKALTPKPMHPSELIIRLYDDAIALGRNAMVSRERTDLHDTRKTIKRLRYLIEAFSPILSKSATTLIIEDSKGMQKAFGHFCDLELKTEFLHQFLRSEKGIGRSQKEQVSQVIRELNNAIFEQIQLCFYRFNEFDSERVRQQISALEKRPS